MTQVECIDNVCVLDDLPIIIIIIIIIIPPLIYVSFFLNN